MNNSEIHKQFEGLWGNFSHELLQFITSKVHESYDAEDILQEVSMKIFKHIDQLEKRSAIKSWLYTITKNTIIDFYKKRKDLLVSPEALLLIEDKNGDDDGSMNDEISECLQNMIFDLPKKYKDVYNLYERKNMKHKEIMEKLDISMATSKIRLMRAKEIFKKNLAKCCNFEIDAYGNIMDYKKKDECCCKNDNNKNCSKT